MKVNRRDYSNKTDSEAADPWHMMVPFIIAGVSVHDVACQLLVANRITRSSFKDVHPLLLADKPSCIMVFTMKVLVSIYMSILCAPLRAATFPASSALF